MPQLVTGASGYVGTQLISELRRRDVRVRALVRDPAKFHLAGVDVCKGDAISAEGLPDALSGCDVAYYLIHSMGRGGDFAERDRRAAHTFGAAARDAGVQRVVYLGGLGSERDSEHLASRAEVARILQQYVPGFVHVRAAMIIGPGSGSFEILRHLVERLPVMLSPRWLETRTQPVAIDDVVRALAELGTRDDVPGEVQVGGSDVLTYRDMLTRYAVATGRRRPRILPVPLLTPRLSSYWIQLVTPVDGGLVKPLVEGLRTETVVRTPPPPGINDEPLGFDAAVRAACAS
jgi:uncharacterized protein YbjT (DUF2867 family)